jgi:beta-1,2-mannobiose phosphorylase / 1,2-beta-oligomannan phosphorylase
MIKIIGTAQRDKESLLYYHYSKGGYNFFKVIASNDGFQFNGKTKYVTLVDAKKREEKSYDWTSFRIAKQQDKYFLTYKLKTRSYANLNGAISTDLIRWTKTGRIDDIRESGALVSDYKHNGKYVMYYGEKVIKIAYSTDLKKWKEDGKIILGARKDHFDDADLEVGNALDVDGNILLMYYVKKKMGDVIRYFVGAALFDKKDPYIPVWRSDKPLWEHPQEFHHEKIHPLGSLIAHGELILYWLVGESNIYAVSCPIPGRHFGLKDKVFSTLFKKFEKNPIIAPATHHPWESRATFNSAAVYEDGKVHFVYRALGDSDLSVLGYATSSDGLHIDERSDEPIYIPREPWETPGQRVFKTFADHFASGGGYGGVEDPRITKVDDKFYMTYVAYDGANPPRVALTSIPVKDFIERKWDKWEKPKLISSPGMVNKNAVIFPEKVNGKYVVLHRVYPNILVDFVDDLDFENKYLQGQYFIPPRKNHWDSKKVGAGAPPIKTKDGWLFIYQSVGHQDPGRYKIGAMLLDKNDPTKVLYRANSPIVEPNESYENEGFKAGVVYPCGAVAMNNNLHVYYGGADSVVCAATAPMDTFLESLKYNQEPKLHRVRSSIINLN